MKYVIYARKSSEGEDRQVQSIDDQLNFAKKLAKKENLEVVKTFFESKSAKDPGRKVFNEMLKFIESQKEIGIITWKLNRLTRNPLDGGKLQWLLQTGVIAKIKTSDRIYSPEDHAVIFSVETGTSSQYSIDLSKDVKRGLKSRLDEGAWPNYAPIGYLNEPKKIVIDKEKAKYLIKAFELYSKGNYSLKTIADILFDEGFRSRADYKYHKSKLHKILSNPFYYGVTRMKGNYYQGKHEPIISKELFDKVQLALAGKSHSKKQRHFFPFRGMLHCEKCGCLLTATKKKGYTYYYCTNGKGECEEHKKYLRSEKIEKILADSLNKLNLSSESVEIMYLAAKEKTEHKRNYKEETLETLTKESNLIQKRRERLLDLLCAETISEDIYKQKEAIFQKDEADLNIQIVEIKKKLAKDFSTLEQTKKVFLSASKGQKVFLKANEKEKRKTLQNLLWNVTIQNQQLAKVSFKPEFQVIANEPNLNDFDKLREGRDSNE